MSDRTGPPTPAKLREMMDLFFNRLLEEIKKPDCPTPMLRVISDFLKSCKIDFRAGNEREALQKLIDESKQDDREYVPFVDPLTKRRY